MRDRIGNSDRTETEFNTINKRSAFTDDHVFNVQRRSCHGNHPSTLGPYRDVNAPEAHLLENN